MLVSLKPGKHDRLYVKPRWPSRIVRIDSDVLNRLKGVSKKLPDSVNLVLTRGYESPSSAIGLFRNALRFFGRKIFLILYPSRLIEIDEIFSPNGHDTDGRHVDLEIMTQNRRVSLLPMGVFTSPKIIARQERHFEEIIQQVRDRIISVGGEFHTNRLEALQMHVDFAE